HATVVAFEGCNTDGTCSFHHSGSDWFRVRSGLNEYRSASPPAFGVWCAMPVFDALVELEYGIVVPRRIIDLRCEEVPIVLVPTCPSHHVYAGSATQDFPHIQRDRAPVEARIGLSSTLPVALAADTQEPLVRLSYVRNVITAACLNQQDADIRIFGESAGDH